MKLKKINTIMLVLTICFLPQNIFSQERNSLENLTWSADIIIIGTVKNINSEWNKDKTRIWSFVKIDLEESIKGYSTQKEIMIRVLGGEIEGEDIGMRVSNSPEFKVGERYFCFLQKDTDSTFAVMGWEAGKFIPENGLWQNKMSKISNSQITAIKANIK